MPFVKVSQKKFEVILVTMESMDGAISSIFLFCFLTCCHMDFSTTNVMVSLFSPVPRKLSSIPIAEECNEDLLVEFVDMVKAYPSV